MEHLQHRSATSLCSRPPPLLAGGKGGRCGTTSTVNSCEFKLLRGLTQLIEPKQQMLLLVLLLLLLLQLDK